MINSTTSTCPRCGATLPVGDVCPECGASGDSTLRALTLDLFIRGLATDLRRRELGARHRGRSDTALSSALEAAI